MQEQADKLAKKQLPGSLLWLGQNFDMLFLKQTATLIWEVIFPKIDELQPRKKNIDVIMCVFSSY